MLKIKLNQDNIKWNQTSELFQDHLKHFQNDGLMNAHATELLKTFEKSKKRKVHLKKFLSRASFNILRSINMSIYLNDFEDLDKLFCNIKFHNSKSIKYALHNLCFVNEEEYLDFFSEDNMGLPCIEYQDFMNILDVIADAISKNKYASINELVEYIK